MTRADAIQAIHTNPDPIYSLMEKAKRKGYICPYCLNGSGKDGDGIELNNDGKFHCFKCGRNGDAIDLYQQIRGIADFNTALAEVAHLYGLSIEQPETHDPATLNPDEKQKRIDCMARRDIERAQKNITHPDCIAYLKKRGISPATAAMFHLGFIPDWQHPKNIANGLCFPKTPRLIIPTGDNSYLARDIRDSIPAEQEKFSKSKVNPVQIFNSQAIRHATRPLFIVEGEIDAMSFYEIGAQAVALGSTSNVDLFLQAINKNLKEPLIIALDNDPAGQEATERLIAGLTAKDIKRYSKANPAGQYKDANEALIEDRAGFAERVRKAERAELDAESNAAYIDVLRRKFARSVGPIPTGFNYLDDLLDGGLFAGLYFIGGVSSSGKTAFSMQIIDQVAKSGGSCLVFAAEMSRADLIARSISRETVNVVGNDRFAYCTQREVQAGYLHADFSEGRLDNLERAYQAYKQYADRITIYENTGDNMKPSRIRQKIARYCHLTGERPLVLVDYLQILTAEKPTQDIRNSIDNTIRALKGISSEYDLPIIVISSLNRDNYTTPLNLAAFKESGNIEYSADYLLGLQFSIVHESQTGENAKIGNLEILEKEKQKAIRNVEIAILKQRAGRSSGIVKFAYDARHNRYQQSETAEEFITANFKDTNEQRDHRERLTGHAMSPDDCPKPPNSYTRAKRAL